MQVTCNVGVSSTTIICLEEIDILIAGKNIVGFIIDIICFQVLKIQTATLTLKLKSSVVEKGLNLNLEGQSLMGPGEHVKVEVGADFCRKVKMRGFMTK